MKTLRPGTEFYLNADNNILLNHGYGKFMGKRLIVISQRKDGKYEVSDPQTPGAIIIVPFSNMEVCSDQEV